MGIQEVSLGYRLFQNVPVQGYGVGSESKDACTQTGQLECHTRENQLPVLWPFPHAHTHTETYTNTYIHTLTNTDTYTDINTDR